MTRRFLCIGECMLELSQAGGGDANLFRAGFAGDAFNTAWYARRVAGPDVEVAFLTAVGTDDVSQRLEDFVRDAGIVPHFTRRAHRTLGLYMINLTNGERSFSYWRNASAARTLADDLDQLPELSAGDMVFFSGITLAILPPEGRARLFAALEHARAAGIRVAFDPNLRPRLWESPEAMRAVVMEGAARADIALPSFEDEAAWFDDVDIAACAARYRAAGASMVVVKNGAAPVLLSHTQGSERIAPEAQAQVVDSTAAGDSFNAAFLMGLEAGLTAGDAARRGCLLSAKVIAQHGALVPA